MKRSVILFVISVNYICLEGECVLLGDANLDGCVDAGDYFELIGYLNDCTGCSPPGGEVCTWAQGDLDRDGCVSVADYFELIGWIGEGDCGG